MDLGKMSIMEQLEMAIVTTEQELLKLLMVAPEVLVRRALLRNNNITSDIVNKLAFDAAQNVSYIAANHPKCTVQREFESNLIPCVKCRVDERTLKCHDCPNKR